MLKTEDDILAECQRRAEEKIKQGVLLREIDMRLIVREVIKEFLNGEDKGEEK